jgi:hypothetical protein
MLWAQREERDGQVLVPARHGDQGWFDYRRPNPLSYVHLAYLSQAEQDRARLEERFPEWAEWRDPPRFFKAGSYGPLGWYAYLRGKNPGFPEQAIEDTYTAINGRLERIENDVWDVESWDVHHWQNLNPVIPEALIQMAMGSPAAVYHGGLLHSQVRYFDPERGRPGLPESVAALVEQVAPESVDLTLVNTDALQSRTVIVQAGGFGEHQFTVAGLRDSPAAEPPQRVDAPHLAVRLGPCAQARLYLGMRRYVHPPSYAYPPSVRGAERRSAEKKGVER